MSVAGTVLTAAQLAQIALDLLTQGQQYMRMAQISRDDGRDFTPAEIDEFIKADDAARIAQVEAVQARRTRESN